MGQPIRRVERLVEAAGMRIQLEQRFQISAAEFGVLRALASAFGKPPPPLPGIEGAESDVREKYVIRMVQANMPQNPEEEKDV